jgi:hypothetical protein
MCLRFVFLLITRLAMWLRLSRREETWKTAEISILRYQFTVLQRHQPCHAKLNWADRALLAAPLGVMPKARRRGLLCVPRMPSKAVNSRVAVSAGYPQVIGRIVFSSRTGSAGSVPAGGNRKGTRHGVSAVAVRAVREMQCEDAWRTSQR